MILKRAGSPYDTFLHFLWAFKHSPTEIRQFALAPLQDQEIVAYERASQDQFLLPLAAAPNMAATAPPAVGTALLGVPNGASNAMTNLSNSMIRLQEAKLDVKKEKEDPRIKAWKKILTMQQNLILNSGVNEQGLVNTDPTDKCISIISTTKGAQVG